MRLLVTRENYFDAAMDLLASDGVSSLKIARLCKALNVTTGSFYGYFGSMDGFIAEFLAHWEQTQTERVAALSNAPADPVGRIHMIKAIAAKLPHNAEAAIRGWAHVNPLVADAQKRVDDRRVEILTKLFLPAVNSRKEAATMAIMAMTLLVGLQQWRSPVTRKDYNRVFNEFEQMVYLSIGQPAAS